MQRNFKPRNSNPGVGGGITSKLNPLTMFYSVLLVILSTTLTVTAKAVPLTIPTSPLVVSGAGADPNIMLMFDDSNSMAAIVVDAPYDKDDSSFNYDCLAAAKLAPGKKISIRVKKNNGRAYFVYGSDVYDFGRKASRNGITGNKQRCFDPNAKYSAKLFALDDKGDYYQGKKGGGSYTGHYLNWYFKNPATNKGAYYGAGKRQRPDTKTRIDIVKEVGLKMVNDLTDVRLGFASFQSSQGSSPKAFGDNWVHKDNGKDGAKIHVTLGDIATRGADVKAAINSMGEDNLTFATPLGEAFADIGRYYVQGTHKQSLTLHPGTPEESIKKAKDLFSSLPIYKENDDIPTSAKKTNAIQYECQSNYIIGLTDGAPHSDGQGANGVANDMSSDLEKYANPFQQNKILDDVTNALYDIDLRTDLEGKNNVRSYIIGFGDGIGSQDLMDSAVELGGGEKKLASNAAELSQAFKETLDAVTDNKATAAKLAINDLPLGDGSVIYKVSLNSEEWSGNLNAYEVEADRSISDTAIWDAASELDKLSYASRVVYTYDGDDGVQFNWSSVNGMTSFKGDLSFDDSDNADDSRGSLRLDYILGDRSQEGNSSSKFRKRSSVLGDIVNSAPVFVGAPNESWDGLYSGYGDFVKDKSKRYPMIYVGANDGMLHGFNVSSGKETLAYVPSQLLSNTRYKGLHALTEPGYDHEFYVDLTPTVSDVYYGGNWHTVLIGGLRGGGKGYFALDITNPTGFTSSRASNNVLWEFNETTDPDDLGYSFSQPVIAKLNNGKWAAIFGNGYNSNNGKAVLYIAYINQGVDGWSSKDFVKIDTGSGSSGDVNGLSSPTVVDTDDDGMADRVYAGDMKGNMWVFDLTVDDLEDDAATKLFTTSNNQPITTAPVIAENTDVDIGEGEGENVLVLFGTGRYLSVSDITSDEVQSFYGVWDNETSELTRSDLEPRILDTNYADDIRLVTGDVMDWKKKSGWYFDFATVAESASGHTSGAAERAVHKSFVHLDAVYVNTIIPNSAVCSSGGTSWIMAVDYISGLAVEYAVLDTNNDGKLTEEDESSIGRSIDGLVSESLVKDDVMWTNVTGEDEGIIDDVLPTVKVGRLGWIELIKK